MSSPIIETSRVLARDVMTFLSEADLGEKEVISFGSGKPDEAFFGLKDAFLHINHYYDYLKEKGLSEEEVYAQIGQYTKVKGIIPEVIKSYWETDYGFQDVDAQNIMLTVGAQEAFLLALLRLCEQDKHTILVENPSYIGMSSLCELNGYDLEYVSMESEGGMNLDHLIAQLKACISRGKSVKLIYAIPEFQNPTGTSMSLEKRKKLIALSAEYDFFILEDNAYGIFRYENERLPCLKELDQHDRVIYVESFSKSVYPSIRVAAMYVTGHVQLNSQEVPTIDLLSEVKAYTTVNTATLDQALLAGTLLKSELSLKRYNIEKVRAIKEKRDLMVSALEQHIAESGLPMTFNVPEGGFFLELKLPFAINESQLKCAIQDYQVIFCPMWFFLKGADSQQHKSIRLSFSKPEKGKIKEGVSNLFSFFTTEMLIQ